MIISRRFITFLRRETLRIKEIIGQAVLSPVINSTLYFIVFGISIGSQLDEVQGISYLAFIVPGIIMQSVINNTYANGGFALFLMKILGNVVDLLVSPLRNAEMLIAYIISSMIRAGIIAFVIWLISLFFTPFQVDHPIIILTFFTLTSAIFSIIGLIVAIFAKEFEQMSLIPTFILTPLTFLGGVFYSIETLPEFWRTASMFNPIVYMVSGFRYGFYGISDVNIGLSLVIITITTAALFGLALHILQKGYKLRA